MTRSAIDNLIYIDDYIDSKLEISIQSPSHANYLQPFQLSKRYKLIFKKILRFSKKWMDTLRVKATCKWPQRSFIDTSFRFKLYHSKSSYWFDW